MNSFGSRSVLRVGSKDYEIYRLKALDDNGVSTKHLPYSLRILLENLLRTEDGRNITEDDIRALAAWNSKSRPDKEIAFTPSRVLLQDFTGVPAVVDLAAMRDAMQRLSGDPTLINPLQPAELVIDHSVQVDEFGTPQSLRFPALGANRLPQSGYSASRYRHRSPGKSGISGTRSVRAGTERPSHGVPGHAGGHRFTHHDD
jgi:aconitase A